MFIVCDQQRMRHGGDVTDMPSVVGLQSSGLQHKLCLMSTVEVEAHHQTQHLGPCVLLCAQVVASSCLNGLSIVTLSGRNSGFLVMQVRAL